MHLSIVAGVSGVQRPLVPWVGGKYYSVKKIVPLIPEHRCYVEPFAGGASIFFNKEPSQVEVLNDVHGDLVNLYRIVRHHPDELARQFDFLLVSREDFEQQKALNVDHLTDIQRAARFLYLYRARFKGTIKRQHFGTSTTGRPQLNLLTINDEIKAAHHRLARVYVERLDWAEVIDRYDSPHSFFFCDPPYLNTEENYGVPFSIEQYVKMAELAETITGKMLITVSDLPEMREAFAALQITERPADYRAGAKHTGSKKAGKELLIQNWEPTEQQGQDDLLPLISHESNS